MENSNTAYLVIYQEPDGHGPSPANQMPTYHGRELTPDDYAEFLRAIGAQEKEEWDFSGLGDEPAGGQMARRSKNSNLNRDKRVIAAVDCPRCGSPAGTPCRGVQYAPHTERRAEWVRTSMRRASLSRKTKSGGRNGGGRRPGAGRPPSEDKCACGAMTRDRAMKRVHRCVREPGGGQG
jgi:hypothetical protein